MWARSSGPGDDIREKQTTRKEQNEREREREKRWEKERESEEKTRARDPTPAAASFSVRERERKREPPPRPPTRSKTLPPRLLSHSLARPPPPFSVSSPTQSRRFENRLELLLLLRCCRREGEGEFCYYSTIGESLTRKKRCGTERGGGRWGRWVRRGDGDYR